MPRGRSWEGWIDEALALMDQRNDQWEAAWGLADAPFSWSQNPPEILFERAEDEVVADLCVVGTASAGGPFIWAWANPAVFEDAKRGLKVVRRFGATHAWSLLTEPELEGGVDRGHECVAIAGRVMNAEGVFVYDDGDVAFFFTLGGFRARPKQRR